MSRLDVGGFSRVDRVGFEALANRLTQLLDLELGLAEQRLGLLRQLRPTPVELNRFVQGYIRPLQAFDDFLKLRERLFEPRRLRHGVSTRTGKAPSETRATSRRPAVASPTRLTIRPVAGSVSTA